MYDIAELREAAERLDLSRRIDDYMKKWQSDTLKSESLTMQIEEESRKMNANYETYNAHENTGADLRGLVEVLDLSDCR